MRNQNKINQLSRKTGHRRALLANLASALIEHKQINTTLAKGKALRRYVEPLITKSKSDTTHSRRVVFSYLQNKDAVTELFREVAPKVADRPGGYTRIIKTGFRAGDSAEMCLIELVDFNEIYTKEGKSAKTKTRRSRRGGSNKAAPAGGSDASKAEKQEEAKGKTEEPKEEAAATPEVTETKEAPKVEAKAEEKKEEADSSDSKEDKKESN